MNPEGGPNLVDKVIESIRPANVVVELCPERFLSISLEARIRPRFNETMTNLYDEKMRALEALDAKRRKGLVGDIERGWSVTRFVASQGFVAGTFIMLGLAVSSLQKVARGSGSVGANGRRTPLDEFSTAMVAAERQSIEVSLGDAPQSDTLNSVKRVFTPELFSPKQVSEGALLPRAGSWMNAVKQFFGVLLLAVAVWIVSPVLPPAGVLLAWAALLIGSGVLLRAIDPLPPQARTVARLGKALGLVALLAGAAMLAGALAGSRDPLMPLEAFRSGGIAEGKPVTFERIASVAELDTRLADAGRPVMLDFYADWCVSCKEMERYTFSNAQVGDRLSGMRLLQVDVTGNTAEHKALLKRFKLFGPPGIIFFDARGTEIPGLRVVGFQSAEKFSTTLDVALR